MSVDRDPLGGPGAVDDRYSVALAEDDVLLREGLASLLERAGFEIAGQGGMPRN